MIFLYRNVYRDSRDSADILRYGLAHCSALDCDYTRNDRNPRCTFLGVETIVPGRGSNCVVVFFEPVKRT